MKLKDLPTKYDFKSVETGKYDEWVEKGYFKAGNSSGKPYTIVIPPPNITGKLHIGHVLDITLQDIIIRRKRMQGYDALYLPGMDHASIATQARVEAELRKQGITRYDLGREKFLEYCRRWKEKYAAIIREQWRKVGIGVDYSRERFTLDPGLNRAVNEVFVRMYKDGLIYRGEKIINWDIQSKTALSNIEVEYKEIEGAFYYFIYPFKDAPGGIEIATTRPETMFGDTALMVHPDDERYCSYIGKEVLIPGTDRLIPIIADEYVDRDFGTGAVKVTPAHDPNDFEVGIRHHLPFLLCMTEDGKMNELAGKYAGMDRFVCREAVTEDLKAINLCTKIEKIIHAVGHSERTGVIVEPRLSKQWFVRMKPLAERLLSLRETEEKVNFVPPRFENTLVQWMTNIRDWCISRQLWWGHRIPAWYSGDEVYVGMKAPEGEGWVRDEDVLDTWFSSGLWPFSTLGWPEETSDLKRYFPTDTLVTGYDIIPFWVARMIFMSEYVLNQKPFENCLIHGLIRDELGRKVSKSLGNGIDIREAFDQYGVDAIRYFLTTSGTPGQDLRYSTEKIEAVWNYINKIWNISRFIGIGFETAGYAGEEIDLDLLEDIDKWILHRLNETIVAADSNFEKFDFGEAAKAVYKFTWNDFASRYLEMTKVRFGDNKLSDAYTGKILIETCAVLRHCLSSVLKMLHPFMPFVTEEIYSRFNDSSVVIASWPKAEKEYNFDASEKLVSLFEIIAAVRNVRAEKNVPQRQKIDLILKFGSPELSALIDRNRRYLARFVNYDNLKLLDRRSDSEADKNNCVTIVLNDVDVVIPIAKLIDIDEEREKLRHKREKLKKEIARCTGMLSNPSFIAKAPPAKAEEERRKLKAYREQLEEVKKLAAVYGEENR